MCGWGLVGFPCHIQFMFRQPSWREFMGELTANFLLCWLLSLSATSSVVIPDSWVQEICHLGLGFTSLHFDWLWFSVRVFFCPKETFPWWVVRTILTQVDPREGCTGSRFDRFSYDCPGFPLGSFGQLVFHYYWVCFGSFRFTVQYVK